MKRKKPVVVDTNILVRYLVDDLPEQTDAIEIIFKKADDESLFVPDLIIAESIYVLSSVYKFHKKDIIEKLSNLLQNSIFIVDRLLLLKAFDIFETHSLSFADAYLAASVDLQRHSTVMTFDKGIHKISSITATYPGTDQ